MTQQRIDRLTPDQEARLAEWRDKWTAIGLSCQPLDYDAAVDAVRRAYAVANLPPPDRFVVCDSPLSGAITAAILKDGDSVGASVRDSVWASVRDSVGASVYDSVWASVGASVRRSVGDSVRASVRRSVGDSVGDSVADSVYDSVHASVWASVGASVAESVGASVAESVYGAHDASWLSFHDYFLSVCGLRCVEPLRPLIDLAHHCGWWIPYTNVCILQHRHCELHRDAEGNLHNANGMAVKYRDGWGVYAWHGVRIPLEKSYIIEQPNRINVSAIDGESNAEVRRVMLGLFGHERYILESGLQPVHRDECGELFRKELPGDEPLVMVRVTNSTPEPDGLFKKYLLRVSPDCRTARAAVAWTFDMPPDEYQPAAQS